MASISLQRKIDSDQEFIEALKKFGSGDETKKYSDEEVKMYMYATEGFDWNCPLALAPDDVWPSLHFAIRYLNVDAVYLLLEMGADPNQAPIIDGCANLTPLQYAMMFVGPDDEDKADNFEAGEIVYILENHVKIESKIEEINSHISNAEDISRQLEELNASVRNVAKHLKDLEKIEEREILLSEKMGREKNELDKIKDKEKRLLKERKESKLRLLQIKCEEKRLSDEKIENESRLRNSKHEKKLLTAQREEKEGKLSKTDLELFILSFEKGRKETELLNLGEDKIAQLTAQRDELCSRESYMSEGQMSYQRNLLKRLHKKRDSLVVKALGSDLECVVCLAVPTSGHIFACAECGNIMCSVCAPKVDLCPMCRQDFKTKPYIRNMALERIAHRLTI